LLKHGYLYAQKPMAMKTIYFIRFVKTDHFLPNFFLYFPGTGGENLWILTTKKNRKNI